MLRRLILRDFVIVPSLELEFHPGFSVLTGETGAGKSILVDALQLALGGRAEAAVVREGATRTEISAEFDCPPAARPWLDEAGFDAADSLLLRRSVDAQGKSRGWVNGSPATVGQLRDLAEHLLDIHGQHAWQGLTRPAAVRELLDARAGVDARALAAAHARWRAAADALERARSRQDEIARERERLAWQLGEIDTLAPGDDEWSNLNAEHTRLAHAQALMDAARQALDAVSEQDGSAQSDVGLALRLLQDVTDHDARLLPVTETLQSAVAQLSDAAHALNSYLGHAELDPQRLTELDARLSAWMGLARRWRCAPDALPELRAQWRQEMHTLDAATDTAALQAELDAAHAHFLVLAQQASAARTQAATTLGAAVTQAMQTLGMAGGRFEVLLLPQAQPQSWGLESVEFAVAGHAGSTPRPLAKVASGGELSRLALAIAVTTLHDDGGAGTLIFDEIDAGIGGAVGDAVGTLMKQLGRDRQVLAVTHLAQVAACADHHYVVAKLTRQGHAASTVAPAHGADRVAEVARMLGGERLGDTRLAHAQAMLAGTPAALGEPDDPTASQGTRPHRRTQREGAP
jgi:DNA repair protein RecN (Recombination protein N)